MAFALLIGGCKSRPTIQETQKPSQPPAAVVAKPNPLVGMVVEVRIPYGSYPKWGPGILLDGHSFVSWVEIRKDMMTASSGRVAAELDVAVGDKRYTVQLKNYPHPTLTIKAGATIKIAGDVVGNVVDATDIETIQKPKTTKYVLLRSIASPEQEKALNAAK